MIVLGGALVWQKEKLQETKKIIDKATGHLKKLETSASFTTLIGQNSIIEDTQNTLKEMIVALEREKQNEEELQTRLDIALKSAQMGVWEIDTNTQQVVWSTQMYEIYEIDPNEIQTTDQWLEFVILQDQARVRESLESALTESEYTDLKYRIKTPSGQVKYIHSSFAVEGDTEGVPIRIVGVNQDITKTKQVEDMKNQLISMAAHELRSPLTTVTWFTHLLKEELYQDLSKEHKDFLDEIEHGGFRMMHLIKDLLRFSRVEMGLDIADYTSLEVVDLNPMIEMILDYNQGNIENKHLEVHTSFSPDPLSVFAHKESLEIIFENLITNAIKYSNQEGTISCTAQIKTQGETFYYKEVKEEQALCVRIADNGIGIPTEEYQKIFEKMYRGEKAKKYHMYGTGVGLYMVQKVVQELGGVLWFTSKEEYGTVFFVIIPVK
jgi:signal transduction histidine kinase